MKTELYSLIKKSYPEAEAQAFLDYFPSKEDLQNIEEIAQEILFNTKYRPFCCAPLSALLTAITQDRMKTPIFMVAGDLFLDGKRIFGTDNLEHSITSKESNLDWDGHCWIITGNYIGDISLCRTAYNTNGLLNSFVTQTFGIKKGFFMFEPDVSFGIGLNYIPKCVVTESDINALCRGAEDLCKP